MNARYERITWSSKWKSNSWSTLCVPCNSGSEFPISTPHTSKLNRRQTICNQNHFCYLCLNSHTHAHTQCAIRIWCHQFRFVKCKIYNFSSMKIFAFHVSRHGENLRKCLCYHLYAVYIWMWIKYTDESLKWLGFGRIKRDTYGVFTLHWILFAQKPICRNEHSKVHSVSIYKVFQCQRVLYAVKN